MQPPQPQQEDILVWFLRVWGQIEANYIRILTGFGIAIVAALIVLFFYRAQTQQAEAARAALGDVYIALYEGRVEDALTASQEVIETYAGEAEAGEALMALANLHYEEGVSQRPRHIFNNTWMNIQQMDIGLWCLVGLGIMS